MKTPTPRKVVKKTTEERRAYQRQYYQAHKERAKEYQRIYNLTHKKKVQRWLGLAKYEVSGRPTVKSTFTASDILHASPEKAARIISKVIRGERSLVI